MLMLFVAVTFVEGVVVMLLKMLPQQQSVVVIVVPLLLTLTPAENILLSSCDKNILLKNCLVSFDKSHNFHGAKCFVSDL